MSYSGNGYPSDDGLNISTKGSIHTSDGTGNTALAVSGNNDYVLVEDSSATDGIAWKVNAHSSVTASSTTTFTNKSIALSGNTITGTLAELDSAIGTTGTASSSTFLRGDNSWATAGASNVEILNDQTLTGTATNITYTPSTALSLIDDYAMIKVIFSGDTDDTANLDFTINSLSEYHQVFYSNLLGSGTSGSDLSATTLQLQTTSDINVARNCFFNLDITNADYNQSTYNMLMTGTAGCVNRSTKWFSCGTVASGTSSGLDVDEIKIALSANNFQAQTQMTTLGFKR